MINVQKLRKRRLALGLRQKDVAEELGFCFNTICTWETGKHRPHENQLMMYDMMLRRYERRGVEAKHIRYDGGCNTRGAEYMTSEQVKNLAAEFSRLCLSRREVSGMMGIRLNVLQTKLTRIRRMTVREGIMFTNFLYSLKKEGIRTISPEYVEKARILLKYYETRRKQLHQLLERELVASFVWSINAQKYGQVRAAQGTHSDPVARGYQRVEGLRSAIAEVRQGLQPVDEAYLALKNSSLEEEREMFLVLERCYGDGESIEDIAQSLGKSERTMHRRKFELVRRVAERLRELELE